MDRKQIRERLVGILSSSELGLSQLDVSTLNEDTSLLDEIIVDSLQLLEFIVAMENAFGFKVTVERLNIDIFDRFGRVVDFVQGSVSAASPGTSEASHGKNTA